ncbi:cytochrome P450 [Trametes sanguinea]|nr:cytochrome P450 [Trametes sanguinea]
MADLHLIYACLATLVTILIIKWYRDPLRSIPTVGGISLPLLSYISSFRFLRHAKAILQEGYYKASAYHGSVFKVAMMDQWLVVVSGPELVDELRKRPDNELSFHEGIGEIVQTRYTLGDDVHENTYHVDIIREKLTRSIPTILPDVIDELSVAVEECIPVKGDGSWLQVNVIQAARDIVARASNRVFVGLPACRNQKYLDLAVSFTMDVVKDRSIINLFPSALKPIVGRMVGNSMSNLRRAIPLLKPVINERWQKQQEYGDDWPDKPNDMLQWVIEAAADRNPSYNAIVQRMLLANFAAIHTSSNSITHAIYHLAERPEYLQDLREEVEPILRDEGWTKTSISKMWKIDSFLRESQRYNGVNLTSLARKAQKDVILSNGVLIPNGTLVVAAAYSTHHDDEVYEDANVFDPFRFARQREAEGGSAKHQFATTSVDYVPFGHGKHACPGRFFAANELKAMLAYIVLNYDIKLGGDGKRPPNFHWGWTVLPEPNAEVFFRKRQPASPSDRVAA